MPGAHSLFVAGFLPAPLKKMDSSISLRPFLGPGGPETNPFAAFGAGAGASLKPKVRVGRRNTEEGTAPSRSPSAAVGRCRRAAPLWPRPTHARRAIAIA